MNAITREQLRTMTSEQIHAAYRAGQLDHLLTGTTPATPEPTGSEAARAWHAANAAKPTYEDWKRQQATAQATAALRDPRVP